MKQIELGVMYMQCEKCGLMVFSEMDLDEEFHTKEECGQAQEAQEENRRAENYNRENYIATDNYHELFNSNN